MTRTQISIIIVLFLIWRVVLFAIASVAGRFLPYAPSFPYATTLLPSFGVPQWMYSFANFDGVHYLTIAREGYDQTNYIQAFFPLFPFVLLHGLHLLFSSLNLLVVGLVIANISFLCFLLLGFAYVVENYSERIAWHFVIAVILFPWSIFFASLYTESLFVVLLMLCFWLAYKKQWYWASVVTILLSATRIVGVLMVPALWIELWQAGEKDWKKYAVVACGSFGLIAYMGYLYVHFADPLYFLHVQAAFGAGRSNGFVLYPQVAYRSLKILLTATHDWKYLTYLEEFLAGTVGVAALVIPFRKIPWGITFFSISAILIPTVSGSFLSMGRFLLPSVPIYILMAVIAQKYKKVGLVLYAASAMLMILNSVLFLQGYWVA